MNKVASTAKSRSPDRLIAVSDRLPVVFEKNKNTDVWSSNTGSGGLVSALMPVLRDRGGIRVGWPGVRDNEGPLTPGLEKLSEDVGYGLEGVYLSDPEIKGSYEGMATSKAAIEEVNRLRRTHGDRKMILSVDRLDYTKGLLHTLRAFRLALERYPDLRETCFLSLHVHPNRESIPKYRRQRVQLEQLTSEINGAWLRPGWIPIHYDNHSLTPTELIAYYRRADILLITALKDGMNLVAKKYCACHPDNDGILLLSEFAGAAAELQKGALLIDPFDAQGTAQRIHEAMTMDHSSVAAGMRRLRRQIRRHDIYHWVNSYLQAITGRNLEDFPKIQNYIPGPPPETQVGRSRIFALTGESV